MVQPRRRLNVVCLAMAIVIALTAGLVGVVGVARMSKAAPIFEPPQALLPGSAVPAGTRCSGLSDVYPLFSVSCMLTLDGKAVYLTLDLTLELITQTRFPAREYTIADLLI